MSKFLFCFLILAVLFPNPSAGAELAVEAHLRILDQDRYPQGYIRPRQPFFLEAVLEREDDWPGGEFQVSLQVFDQGVPVWDVHGPGEITANTLHFRSPLQVFDRVSAQVEVVISLREAEGPWQELERVKVYVIDQPITLPPDRVMMVSKDRLEFEFHGEFPISPTAPVYEYFPEGAKPIEFSRFIVGAKNVQATVFQGEIVRIDILTPQVIDRMRVLITTDQFARTEHTVLKLSPVSAGFFVEERRSGRGFFASPGQQITVQARGNALLVQDPEGTIWEFTSRVYITPMAGGMIRIDSFQRGVSPRFFPQYRGVFELTVRPGDKFQVVNEVSLEEYLYQVVPSEMPVSWPLEALKAQAVAARTYAVAHALNSRNGDRGYHVDDSTSSQVYNNQREAERASRAIDETAGLILQGKDGSITPTYFYASSPEDTASPWYKWSFSLSGSELSTLFNRTLPQRVGTVTDVKITAQDSSGKVTGLAVYGSEGQVEITGELNIRSVLRPAKQYTGGGDVIMERSGGRVLNQALLPSAYFQLDITRDGEGRIKSIKVTGGGSGHGQGMSQWGAKQMADSGCSYVEILEKYYPERELVSYTAELKEVETNEPS